MSNLERLGVRGGYCERLGGSGRLVFQLESGEIAVAACDVLPGPARDEEEEVPGTDDPLEIERAAHIAEGATLEEGRGRKSEEESGDSLSEEEKAKNAEALALEAAAHAEEDERRRAEEGADRPRALKGKLPVDFPGHAALAKAKPPITTFGQLRKLIATGTDEKPWYEDVDDIAEITAGKIAEALSVSAEDDESDE